MCVCLLLGYIRTYIVLPSAIYGYPSGPLFERGISNPVTIGNPDLTKVAISRKQVGVVGAGKAVWNNVHIEDSKSDHSNRDYSQRTRTSNAE